MPEIERHETSSIRVSVGVDGNKINIEAEIKDAEVFHPIDWENKKTRARFTDQVADQMKAILSQRFPTQNNRTTKTVDILCKKCEKIFQVDVPCSTCGGKRTMEVKCPRCGKIHQLVRKDVKNA